MKRFLRYLFPIVLTTIFILPVSAQLRKETVDAISNFMINSVGNPLPSFFEVGGLIKTDQLANGLKCYHYSAGGKNGGGVRVYAKENGDWIIFDEIKDHRDNETLDLIKGVDQELNPEAKSNPEYRVTLPNGIILISYGKGEMGGFLLPNGDYVAYTELDSDPLTYGEFLNPENNFTLSKPKFSDRGLIHKNGSDSVEFVRKVESEFPNDFFYNENTKQAYQVTKDGFIPYGYKGLGDISHDLHHCLGVLVPGLEIKEVKDNGSFVNIAFTNGDFVKYAKGDRVNDLTECHLTYPSGIVIEKFAPSDEYGARKDLIKQTFPDGSKYVGSLIYDFWSFDVGNRDYRGLSVVYPEDVDVNVWRTLYDTGNFFYPDGKKVAYNDRVSEEVRKQREEAKAKKKAESDAAYKQKIAKLYAKYGKANVDTWEHYKVVKIGMNIQMLKELGASLLKDDEGVNYVWYQHHNQWLKVNKSTGKIEFIGKQKHVIR